MGELKVPLRSAVADRSGGVRFRQWIEVKIKNLDYSKRVAAVSLKFIVMPVV